MRIIGKIGLVLLILSLMTLGYGGICRKKNDHPAVITGSSGGSPPSAPTNLTGSGEYAGFDYDPPYALLSITLEWTDTSNNEDGFQIERRYLGDIGFEGDDQDYELFATVGRDMTFYCDDSLLPMWFSYRIRTYNSAGYSSYSNELLCSNN